MSDIKEKTRRRTLKKLLEMGTLGSTFSISFTLLDAIFFRNIYIFFAFCFCVIVYGASLANYYLTFKKKIFTTEYSAFNFVVTAIIALTLLTYIAGGFSGAMISGFFFVILVSGLLFEENIAIYITALIIIIYLTFLVGEAFNIITPVVIDPEVIKYSTAIIDLFSFFVAAYILKIIARNANDAIKFFQLRGVRLSKIKKRLEILVKKRTKELQGSNKKLRKAQIKLKKNVKQLEKLDEAKDHFISIAAHELKTPLTTISGYSQLLKKSKIIKNPKKRKMFLQIVDNESKRLSQLVSEMLDLSRIDMGATRFNIENIDIYELMENIDYEFRNIIQKKGISYEFKLDKNLPKIKTDKDKLHEIITNLVSNSLKYSIKGKITVRAKKKNKNILFTVADTGKGIPKKYHKKIFERFFQVDSTLSREVGGTGLGLSIAKEYAERLGGKIWFKSKVGKGTTFFVKIPIKTKIKARSDRVKIIPKNKS
jgi:signal transduction histidine kinase